MCLACTASGTGTMFKENAANPQMNMIEIKLSQGAKPRCGGLLPGAKVTELIADARGVQVRVLFMCDMSCV